MRFTVLVAIKRAGVAVCWFAFSSNITTMSLLQFLVVMMKCKQQWAAVGRAQNNISRLESTCSCSTSNRRSKRNRYEMTEMFLFNNRCCATLTASPAFLCVCPQPDSLCSGECSVYIACVTDTVQAVHSCVTPREGEHMGRRLTLFICKTPAAFLTPTLLSMVLPEEHAVLRWHSHSNMPAQRFWSACW